MLKLFLSLSLTIGSMFFVYAQGERSPEAGRFSLGVRTSMGLVYENDWSKMSFGNGGQIRLKLGERVNTEWFADFLQGDLGDIAKRTDVHIGWSVMYYPIKSSEKIQPFVLAGHCFEFLKIEENGDASNHIHRKSASVQAGIGSHWHLSKNLDFSATTQYMMHFGTNILVNDTTNPITFSKESGISLQDHVLVNFSLNYCIADLW